MRRIVAVVGWEARVQQVAVFTALVLWLPVAVGWWAPRLTREFTVPSIDFNAFYIAGRATNMGLNPYVDYGEEGALAGVPRDPRLYGLSRFIYPPSSLPLIRFFAYFSYVFARALWAALYSSTYVAAFFLVAWRVQAISRMMFMALGLAL